LFVVLLVSFIISRVIGREGTSKVIDSVDCLWNDLKTWWLRAIKVIQLTMLSVT